VAPKSLLDSNSDAIRPGLPALYFGTSAGVAMLEMAHYLPSPRLKPADYRLGEYEVSGRFTIEQCRIEGLSPDWDAYPHRAETRELGSRWLMSRRTALLLVPSAATPGGLESNQPFAS